MGLFCFVTEAQPQGSVRGSMPLKKCSAQDLETTATVVYMPKVPKRPPISIGFERLRGLLGSVRLIIDSDGVDLSSSGMAEFDMAYMLGHKVFARGNGNDAVTAEGDECEYKSIREDNPSGQKRFNFGIVTSDLLARLSGTKEVFFAVRYKAAVKEIYSLDSSAVVHSIMEYREKQKAAKKTIGSYAMGLTKVLRLGAKLVCYRDRSDIMKGVYDRVMYDTHL